MYPPDSAPIGDRLLELARAQIGGTGGWSLATDPDWLDRMYSRPGVSARTWGAPGGEFRGAASVREDDESGSALTVTTLLRPGSEDLWLEQSAWIADMVGSARTADGSPIAVRVVSEALSDAEVSRWKALGFGLVFEEIAMERDLTTPIAPVRWPDGTTVLNWSPAAAAASYAVYEAAFRERPGFPGWTESEWIDRLTAGDDFLAAASCCVLVKGVPAGFVVCDRGWVDQVGVVPEFRRRGIASALVTEAVARVQSLGYRYAHLHVNANNPTAFAAWLKLGWQVAGRRGRFERESTIS